MSTALQQKPKLSFAQIVNMSVGFFGIQIGFSLQNGNVSRIFQTLGADVEDIPILWIAAPLTGLLVQPIIGHYSDKTWNRLGRRRPYFLVGAILASLALIVMPNSPILWFAAVMLWVMDASINISMEPFRAFVGDMLSNEQRNTGFAMQTVFIGVGAVIGSFLPPIVTALGVDNTAAPGEISDSLKYSFYIGGALFLLAVLYTVFSVKEYDPETLKGYEEAEEAQKKQSATGDRDKYDPTPLPGSTFTKSSIWWIIFGALTTAGVWFLEGKKELYILTGGVLAFGLIQVVVGTMSDPSKKPNGLVEIINDLFKIPLTMRQLAVVQFFTWFGLFSMWIYTTSVVSGEVFGSTDTSSQAYNDGADWVNVLFGIYNGLAAVFAFLLPAMAKSLGRKKVHMIALILGGLSLASIMVIKDQNMLILPMIGIGLAWASTLSVPYAILTSSLPVNKMGVFMGIFNFFIVIPQLCAASILGAMVTYLFNGNPLYALVAGGISMAIGGILTLRVQDRYED